MNTPAKNDFTVYRDRGLSIELDKIKFFKFNGGEVSVKISPLDFAGNDKVTIAARIADADGIMCLLNLVDAIRRNTQTKSINLVLPYLPYARQDRVCDSGESLSIKIMCDLINNCHFDNVTICDPHSDVGPALLNNCSIITQKTIFSKWGAFKHVYTNHGAENIVFIAPDAGAFKKTYSIAESIGADVVVAEKVRDMSTGKILHTKINDMDKLDGKFVFVVDDICDGGRKFEELAKAVSSNDNIQVERLYLFVTHGIFSNGVVDLLSFYDLIGCSDSFLSEAVLTEAVNVVGAY